MQIQFDPNDPRQLAAVAAAVNTLRFGNADDTTISGSVETIDLTADDAETLGLVDDDEPDAAAAFAGNGETAATATAPAAPVAPPASTPAAGSSAVELDADGLPWDSRIHSGPEDTKPKNADGRWRAKRGMGEKPDFVKEVEAELRQVMGASAPAPSPTPAAAAETPPPPSAADAPGESAPAASAPTPAPAPPAPTPDAADTASGPDAATTADSPPAPPANDPPAPPAAQSSGNPFADLMKRVTARQTAGTLTVADTKAAAEALGLTGVADLLKRPDLIEAFEASLPPEAQ